MILPSHRPYLALILGALTLLSNSRARAQSATDFWNESQGNTITASSGQGTGDLRNIFGGNYGTPEAGTAFFRDDQAPGFVHYIEFERSAAFPLTAYRLMLADDSGTGNRGITAFRLYVFSSTSNSFELIDTYNSPSNPYGNAPGGGLNPLTVVRPVTPVTGQKFRAEFVQYSNGGGPRVLELDAISAPPSVSIISPADGATLESPFYNFGGTASDGNGIDHVTLRIKRLSDSQYWNGFFWTSSVTDLSANYDSANGTWSSNFLHPVPPGESMPEGEYHFIAIAVDVIGEQAETQALVRVGNHKSFTFTGAAGQKCHPNDPNEQTGDPTNWSDPRNWGPVCDPQGPPGGNDIAIIPAGYGVNAGGITVYEIVLSGGLTIHGDTTVTKMEVKGNGSLSTVFSDNTYTLTVGESLEHNGNWITANIIIGDHATMNWKRGGISGHPFRLATEAIKVLAGGVLEMTTTDTKLLGSKGLLINKGTVKLKSGIFYVSDPNNNTSTTPDVINEGLFVLEGNSRIESSLNRMMFTNALEGTLRNGGGSNVIVLNFQNLGTIDAEAGEVIFSSLTVNSGSKISGAGAININGDSAVYFDGLVTLTGNINLTGGYVHGEANFQGSGVINWTGGSIGNIQGAYTSPLPATLHLPAGVTMNIFGDADKRLGSPESTCGPCHRQHGVIDNAGTINWSGTGDIFAGYGGGEIINSGTFNVLNDEPMFNAGHGGAFTNNSSGTFRKTSTGLSKIGDGFSFINKGIADIQAGTLQVTGTLGLHDGSHFRGAGRVLSTGGLHLVGTATVDGNGSEGGTVELNEGILWTGVEGAPTGTIATAENGKFEWTGGVFSGQIYIAPNSQLLVKGTAEKQLGYWYGNYSNNPGTLNNAGTIIWTGAGGITDYNTGIINNTGTFIAQNDATLVTNQFNNHGTFRKEFGAVTLIKGGPFRNYGTVDCKVGEMLLDARLELYNNSSTRGAGRVASQKGFYVAATTNIDGDGVDGGTLELRDDILWTGEGSNPTGTIQTSGNGKFEWTSGWISGMLDVAPGSRFLITGPNEKRLGYWFGNYSNATGTLTNRGTVTWSGTGAIQDHNYGHFFNHGTFQVQTNALMTARLENRGTLDIGSSIGTFTFAGAWLTQTSTGTLNVDLGGTAAGTQFDLIANNWMTLDGTLNVRLAPGYDPGPSDTFKIINNAGGQFAKVILPNAQYFQTEYANNSVTLVAKAFPENNNAWMEFYFPDPNAPEAQPLADPNNNGLPNVLEYALGRNPLAGGGAAISASAIGLAGGGRATTSVTVGGVRYMSFSYRRPGGTATLNDVIYTPERASTLTGPNWTSEVVEHSAVLDPATSLETVTVRSTHPMSEAAKEFMRLKVTVSP